MANLKFGMPTSEIHPEKPAPPTADVRRVGRWFAALVTAIVAVVSLAAPLRAEEIRLHSNERIYGFIDGLEDAKTLRVLDASGAVKKVLIEDIVSIAYRGRDRRMIQSGTQDFQFVGGGRLRAQILGCKGDALNLLTNTSGVIGLDADCFAGFVALPVMGLYGRKALEMAEFGMEDLSAEELNIERMSPFIDLVMDRRGSTYPGVVRRFAKEQLMVDHETLVGQSVEVKMLYVAGVRMADAGRRKVPPFTTDIRVRVYTRDDSILEGTLDRIHLDIWHIRPVWNPTITLPIDLQEIRVVQLINGRMQYLSQLTPVEVKETTVLAPPQPYQMDKSCQGDPIVIAGQQYPWGVGVHADSELTFKLGKRFKTFRSAIGIADQVRKHGSVVFQVLGDGKVLYTSPTVKAGEPAPREIEVPVTGVDLLTLKVTNAGDLDLGDVANWGSARLER